MPIRATGSGSPQPTESESDVRRLVIVAGPCCCGKTTLVDAAVAGDPDASGRLGLSDVDDFRTSCLQDLRSVATDERDLLLQVDSLRTHARAAMDAPALRKLLDLAARAESVEVIVVRATAEQLADRVARRVRTDRSFPLTRGARLALLYRNPRRVAAHYDRFRAFCEQLGWPVREITT